MVLSRCKNVNFNSLYQSNEIAGGNTITFTFTALSDSSCSAKGSVMQY